MNTRKIAVITGGSRGLGKHMAIHLAKQGRDIIFTYRNNQQEAQSTPTELTALGIQAHSLQLDLSQKRRI